jgi:hypothetical protein
VLNSPIGPDSSRIGGTIDFESGSDAGSELVPSAAVVAGRGNIDPIFLHGISGGDYYFSDNVI